MRSILAGFVVAWLNLALQPCAMALGTLEGPDCPRCPPAHEDEQIDHAMHGSHTGAEESASVEMPCSIAAADCTLLDEFSYDGRTVKLELNDAPHDSPVATVSPIYPQSNLPLAEHVSWHPSRSPPRPASVPLNVYYCVYLK